MLRHARNMAQAVGESYSSECRRSASEWGREGARILLGSRILFMLGSPARRATSATVMSALSQTDAGFPAEAPLLSVVFITYRRVALLRQSCEAFARAVTYPRLERIVADDGSPAADQAEIRRLPFDRYLLAPRNRGLGSNNNAALQAASGEFILMLQDDWSATALADAAITRALAILAADDDVGMVRFYPGGIAHYPLQVRQLEGRDYYVCDHLSPAYDRRWQVYSDTPHIRRARLNDPLILGRYREGVPMETSEQDYADRFDSQSRHKIAFLDRGEAVYFVHTGEDCSFRTSKWRYKLDAALLKLVAVLGLRRYKALYRHLHRIWFALRAGLIRVGLLR